jgi:hypothetical protein
MEIGWKTQDKEILYLESKKYIFTIELGHHHFANPNEKVASDTVKATKHTANWKFFKE